MYRTPTLRRTLALSFLTAALLGLAGPSLAQTVEYPILVYSTSRGQHDVPATVHVTNASQAVSLCVTTHQAGYHMGAYIWANWNRRDDAAGIRLNGGSVVTDWNSTGTVDYPADRYEGVGGAYHTVRTCFPVNGGAGSLGTVQEGANTVNFRFYGVRDHARSGYRVIDIDIESAAGTDLITSEVHDDPEQWTIANTVGEEYDNPAAIAEGEALWSARNTLVEIDASASMVAACNDCHAYSGYDLKYFNYEPDVIVTRAVHHGLTEEEARKIAAYVLSLDLERPDGRETTPKGRPWSPVFQPGPGLNDGLEEDWSAGAGLEWVLAHDHETFDYLFSHDGVTPNPNPTDAEMRAALSAGVYTPGGEWENRIDVQNLPVAIQYPDWNNWLPDIHPFDAYGYDTFLGFPYVWELHLDMYERLDTQAERDALIGETRESLAGGNGSAGLFGVMRVNYGSGHIDGADEAFNFEYVEGQKPQWHLGRQSLIQWQLVKSWEVVSRYKLLDLADDYARGITVPASFNSPHEGEELRLLGSLPEHDVPFMWPTAQSLIFFLAPHMSTDPGFRTEGPYGPPGTEVMQSYFSSVWYDVQLIVSPENIGLPSNNGGQPVDWSYMSSLAMGAQEDSGVSHWARDVRQRVFAWQSRNNHHMQRDGPSAGPAMGRQQLNWFELVGRAPRIDEDLWPGALMPDQGRALDILFAATREWIDYVSSVPVVEWDRNSPDRGKWPPVDFQPTPYSGGYRFQEHDWANNAYHMAPWLFSIGANASLVSDIATWGESMWPLGDWEQWILEDPPPAEPVQQALQLDAGWNLISSYVAPADSSMAAIWQPVASLATVVRDALGHEFFPAEGTGTLEYWRRGEGYQVYMTEPAVLTLQGELVTPEATPLSLHEGWNQVAYLGTSQASVAEAFSGILPDLVAVKKNDGAVFMPEYELDQIGLLSPGEGYKLLLADDAVLVYPPNSEGGRVTPPQGTLPQGRPAGERRPDRIAAPQARGTGAGAQ